MDTKTINPNPYVSKELKMARNKKKDLVVAFTEC